MEEKNYMKISKVKDKNGRTSVANIARMCALGSANIELFIPSASTCFWKSRASFFSAVVRLMGKGGSSLDDLMTGGGCCCCCWEGPGEASGVSYRSTTCGIMTWA